MRRFKLLMVGLLFCTVTVLTAQNKNVTGIVIDATSGEPIPFATIQIKGTTTGISTDDFGKFGIDMAPNATLIFSSIGYIAKEVAISSQSSLMVKLEPDALMLEEVVFIGYGSAKKITSVVGAVKTVSSSVIESKPAANVADALQGQVAGLQIYSSSGEPMANVSMRLRGVNSINALTTPLFILDGAPVSSSIFTSLNPNDIENVTVLKDASSTAIYGSRAANGVIYITTKKGKRGEKAMIQVRGQYGISQLTKHNINLMSSAEWFKFNEMVNPNFLTPQLEDQKEFAQKYGINTDWTDYFFNNAAPTWSSDVSISGASKSTDYYISLGAYNQEGTAPNSGMGRYNLRSNINTRITDWFKVGVNLGLVYQDYQTAPFANVSNSPYNPINSANWLLPWISPREHTFDGAGNIVWGEDKKNFPEMGAGYYNTKYLQSLQPSNHTYARINASTYEEFTPMKGLTIRAAQALEAYDYTYDGKSAPEGPFEDDGTAIKSFGRNYAATFTNTIEYKNSIKKNHFSILFGQEAILTDDESWGVSVTGITDERFPNINDGTSTNEPVWSKTESVFNSYFASLSYDYNNKYFLDGSYRIDGSSKFGIDNQYAHFYSLGAMWNIKNEDFLKNSQTINDLRLKVSYGTVGNSGIGDYKAFGTVGSIGLYDGNAALGLGSSANPNLTWEVVNSFNVGISTRLFNRLTLNVDFYNKLTTDMLMTIPYSFTTGHTSGYGNIGDMRNTGVDVDFNLDIIRTKDFYFSLGATFNYNKNEITKLFGDRDSFIVPGTSVKYQVGKPLGELFEVLSAGVDPADGYQMWYDINGNKTKKYSTEDATFTGKQINAPLAGGVQLVFSWKGLQLNADFSWVAGKYMVNNDKWFYLNPEFTSTQQGSSELLDIWTKPGDITDIPRFESVRRWDDTFIENASFLRLKNLQLSYSLPKELMDKTGFLGGVKIFAVARNLFTITEYTGYDPEVDGNVTLGSYPNSKQYSLGIELSF